MKLLFSPIFMSAVMVTSAHAQLASRVPAPELFGRSAVAADSAPLSIAQAEAQASRLGISTLPLQVIDGVEGGTSERKCVEVGSKARVRSGDFVAGGLSSYNSTWLSGGGKIAWWPLRASWAGSPKIIRFTATRLDAPTATPWIFDGEFTAGGYFMYPGHIHFPDAGRWMLVGSTENDWGCFVMDVTW